MVIDLDPRVSVLVLETFGLTLQSSNASCRYLGVLVGHQDAVDDNWNSAFIISGADLSWLER